MSLVYANPILEFILELYIEIEKWKLFMHPSEIVLNLDNI